MIQSIAIDGPAASGKTAVGRELARRLGWWFLDTGVMYRAVTWLALERGVSPNDADALGDLVQFVQVKPVAKNGDSIEVAGHRVGSELRQPRIDNNVSNVSRHTVVRRALTQQQRDYARAVTVGADGAQAPDAAGSHHSSPSPQPDGASEGIVMVGRDIGTVVLPDAGLKVFLTASAEERARRRWREMQKRGQGSELAAVLSDIQARDAIDSSRDDSPLRPADDAWLLDTSGLTIDEVVEAVLRQAANPPPPHAEGKQPITLPPFHAESQQAITLPPFHAEGQQAIILPPPEGEG